MRAESQPVYLADASGLTFLSQAPPRAQKTETMVHCFDGAIDVEWLIEDRDKARRAAEAFVFHGPTYHGVSQQDIGTEHGHKLVDSATFVQKILQRSNGNREISPRCDAGYTDLRTNRGVGK